MINLIHQTSPLKCLPQEIGCKDILIFDSLRFTCEIIEHSYKQLMSKVLEISHGTSKEKNLPSIFGYAWSIIDQAVRLSNICKKLPWEKPNEIVGHLHYLKDYRHTYQHLDERIEESLLENKIPFYGIITWIHKLPDNENFNLIQLISGNWIAGKAGEQIIPEINKDSPEIIDLCIHTVNRKGEVIFTNIEDIIEDVKKLVTEIENRFNNLCVENNIQLCDWSKRQDVILTIKNKPRDF